MTVSLDRRVVASIALVVAILFGISWDSLPVNAQSSSPRLDLLWQHQTDGGLQRWEMDGSVQTRATSLSPAVMTDPNWIMVGSGDFNADGLADVVWHHQTSGQVAVWYMNGTTQLEGVLVEPGGVSDTDWKVRAVGDLNNDRKPDLIWERQTDGLLAVWFMQGIGFLPPRTTGTLLTPAAVGDAEWHIVGTGDVDGDQKTDLIWQHQTTGQLAAWYMNADTQREPGVLLDPDVVPGDSTWRVRTVADVDKDGHPDLLWQHPVSRMLATWLMNGPNRTVGEYLTPSETPGPGWLLMTASTTTQASTPRLSVASGIYAGTQTVAVTTTDANAVLRYTTSGATPGESDAVVPPGGGLTVDRSLPLRVRSWVSGLTPSLTASADYTLQAATPTFSPAGGTYTTAQTVVISTATTGATIRYTTDGSDPTESSTIYSTPISLANSATVKAAAFKTGWSASGTAATAYTFQYGTLATPSISPVAGTYVHGETITISGPAGATLRYTTDGTTPNESSPVYTGPLTLLSSMTISARAFKPDWTPSAIATAAFEARAAAPVLSVPSGTYAAETIVSVATTTPDATLHYTLNGNDPTEADPSILSGGTITVDRSLVLRVRAWAPGHVASDMTGASFVLQPIAPSISPAPGIYTSEQTVAITSATPHTILRYTTDSTDPSEVSPAYSGPFVVTPTVTVKARAFRTGWMSSDTTSAILTLAQPTVETPVATPGGGHFGGIISVSLTSTEAAHIRYTVDGSEPSSTSVLYSEPLLITEGTRVLKVKAFKDDWTPSPTLTATYAVELPFSISAEVSPLPNAAGWNKTDVRVSFRCTGAATCPEPVNVTQEGIGLVASGTATTSEGVQATASVTLNIDKTSPTVTNMLPLNGAVFNDTWNAQITAAVADFGSGLAAVKCNGISAEAVADVTCPVSLRPGYNSAVVTVMDLAGNSSSMGRSLFAAGQITSIRISPSTRTILVGEHESLFAVDQAGRPVSNVSWLSSEPSVVSVEDGQLMPLSPGQAEVTAEYGGMTASASVTVISGSSRPAGTVKWKAIPEIGQRFGPLLFPNRVDPNVPDFATVQYDEATGSVVVVQGFSAEGGLVRIEVPPVPGNWNFGPDRFGGLLAWGNGLTRFGGKTDISPWHYEPEESSVVSVAQGSDSTVFLTETGQNSSQSVVVLDGETGQVRTRLPLRPGHVSVQSNCIEVDSQEYDVAPTVSGIAVGGDGVARLTVVRESAAYFSPWPCSPTRDRHTLTWTTELLEIHADGSTSIQNLQTSQTLAAPVATDVTPIGAGGSLVSSTNGTDVEWRSIPANGVPSPIVVPSGGGIPRWNSETGGVAWIPSSSQAHDLLDPGGAVIGDGTTIEVIDAAGNTETVIDNLPMSDNGRWSYWSLGLYAATAGGTLVTIAGPVVNPSATDNYPEMATRAVQSVPLPQVDIFLPERVLIETPLRLAEDYRDTFGLSKRINATFLIDSQATDIAFRESLKKPVNAIAFLGHANGSASTTAFGVQTMGLRFNNRSLMIETNPQMGPFEGALPEFHYDTIKPPVEFQAKILFVAACWIGPVFLDAFQITETGRQALVYAEAVGEPPPGWTAESPDIPINRAAEAWKMLLTLLLDGQSVANAVSEVNNSNIIQLVDTTKERKFILKAIGGNHGATVYLTK